MSLYHFLLERPALGGEYVLPETRISVEYGKTSYVHFGQFSESAHFVNGARQMLVGNCEGSLMVIDCMRTPINKLHIGELSIKRPHAESYEHHGEAGMRVDLGNFDLRYAGQMLRDLERWRDAGHREELLEQYKGYSWYCVSHRKKQLKISGQGLEVKIAELQAHVGSLKHSPNKHLVSDTARQIEERCYTLASLMGIVIHGYEDERKFLRDKGRLTKKQLVRPKMIVNDAVFSLGEEIKTGLHRVMDFIGPHIDLQRARHYWDEIDSWEKL